MKELSEAEFTKNKELIVFLQFCYFLDIKFYSNVIHDMSDKQVLIYRTT